MKRRTIIFLSTSVVVILAACVFAAVMLGPRLRFEREFGFALPDDAEIENYSVGRKAWRVKLTEDQYPGFMESLGHYLETTDYYQQDFEQGFYDAYGFRDFYDMNDEFVWGASVPKGAARFVKALITWEIGITRDKEGDYHFAVVEF